MSPRKSCYARSTLLPPRTLYNAKQPHMMSHDEKQMTQVEQHGIIKNNAITVGYIWRDIFFQPLQQTRLFGNLAILGFRVLGLGFRA